MALKVELKPGERLIVGESLITNDHQRTRLFIEGTAPILREKDILTPETADTPAKRIYLCVQLMYLSREPEKIYSDYFTLVNEIIAAVPRTVTFITEISNLILNNEYYKALKATKKLIDYEGNLLSHVQSGSSNLSAYKSNNG